MGVIPFQFKGSPWFLNRNIKLPWLSRWSSFYEKISWTICCLS